MYPSCRKTLAFLQASTASLVWARFMASGFSHRMCLPAAATAWICFKWQLTGEAMYTASTSGSASKSASRSYALATLNSAATRSMFTGSITATKRQFFALSMPGMVLRNAMPPAPMTPKLTQVLVMIVLLKGLL